MKTQRTVYLKGFTGLELLVVATVAVVVAGLAAPQVLKAMKRAALADGINNAKQVKLTLDSFATDFDGRYPSEKTGKSVIEGGTGSTYSND